jgi:hypothetical protein
MRPQQIRTQLFRITLLVVALAILVYLGGKIFPFRMVDFTVYWSAAAVTLEGNNPYLPQDLMAKQMETGWSLEDTRLMYYFYPPWTLALFLPFGLLAFDTGQALWYLMNVGLIMLCARTLWLFYGGKSSRTVLAWLVSLLFAPTFFALIYGQVSPLLMLGLTGFIVFSSREKKNTDLLAGVSAGLFTLKPTLLYLFWPALLFWSVHKRRWHVLVGLAGALAGSLLLVMVLRPAILSDYVTFLGVAEATDWGVPTFGSLLRRLLGVDQVWLQFIPPAAGLIGFLFWWNWAKENWKWKEHLPWLLFGSIITTVYTWTHDQVLFLPAIISTAAELSLLSQTNGKKVAWGIAVSWFTFNGFLLVIHFGREDSLFLWQAPAILVFYLIARKVTTIKD